MLSIAILAKNKREQKPALVALVVPCVRIGLMTFCPGATVFPSLGEMVLQGLSWGDPGVGKAVRVPVMEGHTFQRQLSLFLSWLHVLKPSSVLWAGVKVLELPFVADKAAGLLLSGSLIFPLLPTKVLVVSVWGLLKLGMC